MKTKQLAERSVKLALNEANFRLRPLHEPELRAIVRAMLALSTSGVLFTGVDHRSIGCNAIFGDIFRVDPNAVPHMEVEELRSYVYPRLSDVAKWLKDLEDTYSNPLNVFADELLLQNPRVWVRRKSSPLLDGAGNVLGRLWTFDDITAEKDRRKRSDAIQRVSVFHHPDPKVVCQKIMDEVADYYETTSILSIQQGEMMVFRATARPDPRMAGIPGNRLSDTFCQFALADGAATIVQDARNNPKYGDIMPVRLGLVSRYLGVPLLDSEGRPVGTLCILDSKSDEILSAEDAEFMSVMANRISVELERDRLFELRLRDQRVAFDRQASELQGTRAVLRAMNLGVALAESAKSEADLIARQEKLLDGILGFRGVRLHDGVATPAAHCLRTWRLDGNYYCLEFYGAPDEYGPEYLDAHVSAIADQVELTLQAFHLKRQLLAAQEQIRATQDRLIQAEKLGVAGALSATVAHDIRNIMSSIALEADFSENPAEALRRVRRQVERFSVLSHRLLSYVKPKFMARESVDMNALLRRALDLLDPQIRASKIVMDLDLADALPVTEGDPNQLEHLFVNLIVNALQAVSRAGGTLRIVSSATAEGIRISLTDNGRGMAPDTLERIFDPFFSLRTDGFGLGLFSCKRIAEEHGGKLTATSRLGEGSEFTLVVPRSAE